MKIPKISSYQRFLTRVYLFETKQILIVSFILHFSRHRIVLLRVVIFNI